MDIDKLLEELRLKEQEIRGYKNVIENQAIRIYNLRELISKCRNCESEFENHKEV